MSSRSLLLQLPRDILHSVYSEWLSSWRDLSCLDVGCVGKGDREAWLCSLSELKMISGKSLERLHDESMGRWYEWVISRKVLLVEMFPVRLSALFILAAELDFGSYCPALRSIEIEISDLDILEHPLDSKMLSVLEERLYLFVRGCIHLEAMRYIGWEICEYDDMIFSTLSRGLKANILRSISITFTISPFTFTLSMILQFLSNHVSSMEDLDLYAHGRSKGYLDEIKNILHEKRSPLKKLCLAAVHISLLVCLSSVGVHLETLEVNGDYVATTADYVKGEFLSTLGRSCPQLRRLKLSASDLSDEISVSKIYQLYELCPNFTSFHYSDFKHDSSANIKITINVNDRNELECTLGRLALSSSEEKEMFLECMRLAIRRSQCKLTVSNTDFCYNLIRQHDDWVLMKSKLSPYLTDLEGRMSVSILIEAVKELPRLEKVTVYLAEERFSDLSLSVLKDYGYGLKRLWLFGTDQCSLSDEMISEIIRGCEMLEELNLPGAGHESVLAVKHHSRLREVRLDEVIVGKEEMSRLLCVDEREGEEKCVWRRLRKGEISGRGFKFTYKYMKGTWY